MCAAAAVWASDPGQCRGHQAAHIQSSQGGNLDTWQDQNHSTCSKCANSVAVVDSSDRLQLVMSLVHVLGGFIGNATLQSVSMLVLQLCGIASCASSNAVQQDT